MAELWRPRYFDSTGFPPLPLIRKAPPPLQRHTNADTQIPDGQLGKFDRKSPASNECERVPKKGPKANWKFPSKGQKHIPFAKSKSPATISYTFCLARSSVCLVQSVPDQAQYRAPKKERAEIGGTRYNSACWMT